MIINLRGTNGSGKSYLVQTLLKKFPSREIGAKSRPSFHRILLENTKTLVVVGPYVKPCGGCDTMQHAEIWPAVMEARKLGTHVLFEGMVISGTYGSIGQESEKLGKEFVFAFLDTPTEVAIQNVIKRRTARGNEKEFDPSNLLKKHRAVYLVLKNLVEKYQRQVVILNHKKAVPQLLGVLYGTIRPEVASAKHLQLFPKADHFLGRSKS